MATWVIDKNPEEIERKNREKYGDEGYEDRVAVAAKKVDEFPEDEWEQACIYGSQFEGMAMASPDPMWEKFREMDYRFWVKLFLKLAV